MYFNNCSGGSRNFKTQGRGPDAVELLGSGTCFDAPLHIPNVFVVNTYFKHACWLQIKYMRVMQSNFTKNKPNKFFKRGGARPVSRSWIRLWTLTVDATILILLPTLVSRALSCANWLSMCAATWVSSLNI